MKSVLTGAATVLALCPSLAFAIGLDRSGQPVDVIFEEGNYFELSFGRIMPSIDGSDLAVFGGRDSGNVADDYNQIGAGLKFDITDSLSMALIVDEPYGSDIFYPQADATDGSIALGGTRAKVDSAALTALARYRINDSFSVHGGLRYQQIEASVSLGGAAYGGLDGYDARFGQDGAFGYVLGAAYERPDIALRVALTYSSSIDHELDTTETLNGIPVSLIDPRLAATSTTDVTTPASWNLDVQTGIAPDTLLFGSVRYAEYSDTIVSPVFFDTAQDGLRDRDSLTDIESATSYSLGVGRRFSDQISASFTLGYEDKGDDLVSPLAPTNGRYSASIGVAYNVSDSFTVSGGLSYVWLGDAQPETGTPDMARADFTDNEAVALGMKFGYRF